MFIPGSAYNRLVNVSARLVGRFSEAKNACDTKRVDSRLRKINLFPEKLVSLDVTSLFTMVPLHGTVTKTANVIAEIGISDAI